MDILKIRKSLGMTQKEFGDAIGVDKSVVYKYEHGLAKPPRKRMERIDLLVSIKGGPDLLVECKSKDTSYKDRLLSYAKLLILMGCDGCCEKCGEDAPFRDKDNRPYLLFYKVDDDIAFFDAARGQFLNKPFCVRKALFVRFGHRLA